MVNGRLNSFERGTPFESIYADSVVPVVVSPVRVDIEGTLNSFDSAFPLESTYEERAADTNSLESG